MLIDNKLMDKNSKKILYTSINQSGRFFSIGTEVGFQVYNANPLKLKVDRKFEGGVSIIEMFYNSNILALVGTGQNTEYPLNRLIFWDEYKRKIICNLTYNCYINNVRLKNDKYALI